MAAQVNDVMTHAMHGQKTLCVTSGFYLFTQQSITFHATTVT